MTQSALTAVVPIFPEKLADLRNYLKGIRNDVENNQWVRFRQTPSTHFARWVILEDIPEPRLYFSACYDGSFESYMEEITSRLGAGMEPIWSSCKGYTLLSASNPKAFADFLSPYCYQPQIFLVSFPGLSADQIIKNAAIRESIDNCLDSAAFRRDESPSSDAGDIQSVSASSDWGKFFGNLFGRLTDWLVGVKPGAVSPETIFQTAKQLTDVEDRVVQNQMTILSTVKKGRWPRVLLRFFLMLGGFNKPTVRGQFSGLSTIHFARWVLIDDGNTLLFESNYDGSWESYIDDFGDHAASGMNAVRANCDGFPKGGCLDIESFKKVIRNHQHPAQVFYSAYPNQTVTNIANDLRFRKSLAPVSPFLSGAVNS
jgi:hypothetical protein